MPSDSSIDLIQKLTREKVVKEQELKNALKKIDSLQQKLKEWQEYGNKETEREASWQQKENVLEAEGKRLQQLHQEFDQKVAAAKE